MEEACGIEKLAILRVEAAATLLATWMCPQVRDSGCWWVRAGTRLVR